MDIATDPTAFVRSAMPLCDQLGVDAEEVGADRVVLRLPWRAELCTAGGVLHGGALMTLADSAAATLAYLRLPEGATGTTTVDAHTSFLGACRDGQARAIATVVHGGRTTMVLAVEVEDASGRALTRTTQTQLVLH